VACRCNGHVQTCSTELRANLGLYVFVKLPVAWDKRIILSKNKKVNNYSMRGIFIVSGEPAEVRKNTFESVKY